MSTNSFIRRNASQVCLNSIFKKFLITIFLNYSLINNIRETINQFVQRFAPPGTHINLNANLNMNSNVLIIHLRGQLYLFAHYLDNNDSVSRLNNYM